MADGKENAAQKRGEYGKKKIKRLVVGGIVCALILAVSVLYSIQFNGGRLVEPMDFSTYVFEPKDMPMILAGILIAVYALYIAGTVILEVIRKKGKTVGNRDYTRSLPPQLGCLGILGCLGFMGIWTYQEWGIIYPFIFFAFFGFFGLFFEGKMSHTLKDELYLENERKAEQKAYKIGFMVLFLSKYFLYRYERAE